MKPLRQVVRWRKPSDELLEAAVAEAAGEDKPCGQPESAARLTASSPTPTPEETP